MGEQCSAGSHRTGNAFAAYAGAPTRFGMANCAKFDAMRTGPHGKRSRYEEFTAKCQRSMFDNDNVRSELLQFVQQFTQCLQAPHWADTLNKCVRDGAGRVGARAKPATFQAECQSFSVCAERQ